MTANNKTEPQLDLPTSIAASVPCTPYEVASLAVQLAGLQGRQEVNRLLLKKAYMILDHASKFLVAGQFQYDAEDLDSMNFDELQSLLQANDPHKNYQVEEKEKWWKALLREKAPRKKDADPNASWLLNIKYPIRRNLALGWITDTNRKAQRVKYLEAAGVPEEGDDINNSGQFYYLAEKLEPYLPFRREEDSDSAPAPEPELTPAVVNGEAERFEKAPTRRYKKTGRFAKIVLHEGKGSVQKKEK